MNLEGLYRLFQDDKSILILMYTLKYDGVTKSLIGLMEALKKGGYRVEVVTLLKQEEMDFIKSYGIYASEHELWKAIEQGSIALPFLEKVDVLIAYDGILTSWGVGQVQGCKKKMTWLHAGYEVSHKGFQLNYTKMLYEKMNFLVCVSHQVKEDYRRFLGDSFETRLKVIYPIVNREVIQRMSGEQRNEKERLPTVVSVGRLSTEKGFERLIHVHNQLQQEGYRHRLLILGEGEEKEALEDLIQIMHIEESCILMGYQSNPYIMMQQATCIVSASYGEGLPLVLIEAMLLYRPIVATDVMGNHELLKDDLGLLVENSQKGLYLGIKRMLTESSLRAYYTKRLKETRDYPFE
ncbi:glycosyltransferase [Niameybacter massiliensis]|uniref:glycosyltransferase n=1 Tax=Niameybacter massiliensis TaxID=1658108 RepID=UPI0006B69B2B|nr:glycosyltransferase [Niameybacter massiliensis]